MLSRASSTVLAAQSRLKANPCCAVNCQTLNISPCMVQSGGDSIIVLTVSWILSPSGLGCITLPIMTDGGLDGQHSVRILVPLPPLNLWQLCTVSVLRLEWQCCSGSCLAPFLAALGGRPKLILCTTHKSRTCRTILVVEVLPRLPLPSWVLRWVSTV